MKKATTAKQVIVRTYSAGVHYGTLVSRDGKEVALADARRIWSWRGANTLHEIALRGVGAGSRVSERVAAIVLTEAVEVIDCAPEGVKSMEAATWAA